MNVFKNKTEISQKGWLHIDEELLYSRQATGVLVHLLSGCFSLDGNLVTSLYEKLINIARLMKMWMFVRA